MDTTKEAAQEHGYSATPLPDEFNELGEEYFSIGQSENYYETIRALGGDISNSLLNALRDLAFDTSRIAKFKHLDVYQDSVVRYLDSITIGKFAELAHGRIALTPFHFQYTSTSDGGFTAFQLEFKVVPNSTPPTNLHAIIGRNGVGKTYCLRNMAMSIVAPEKTSATFRDIESQSFAIFSRVVSVSFSAFDPFFPIETTPMSRVQHNYVGLKSDGGGDSRLSVEDLFSTFANAVQLCKQGVRRERWRRGLQSLTSDPIFAESQIVEMATTDIDSELLRTQYMRLSSGHKIILLTVTRLVATTEERTLILLDEPEAHLHPPLLSAFVRCLSDLLVDRNAVAVVATHSPVVLQEVPSSCVHMLYRYGTTIDVYRPDFETFGEGIGRLTSEVFKHEVTESGFHRLLRQAAESSESYEEALAKFNGQLVPCINHSFG